MGGRRQILSLANSLPDSQQLSSGELMELAADDGAAAAGECDPLPLKTEGVLTVATGEPGSTFRPISNICSSRSGGSVSLMRRGRTRPAFAA